MAENNQNKKHPGKSLSQIMSNIKVALLGQRSAEIDTQINKAVKQISRKNSNIQSNPFINTMKNISQKTGNQDIFNQFVDSVSGSQGVTQEIAEQRIRSAKYDEFDAIIKSISYVRRAVNVISDHIVSPDNVNTKTVVITSTKIGTDNVKLNQLIGNLITIRNRYKIDDQINDWVFNILKYGDGFVEIIYSPNGQNAFSILSETQNDTDNNQIALNEHKYGISQDIDIKDDMGKTISTKHVKINLIESAYAASSLFQTQSMQVGGVAGQTYTPFSGSNLDKNQELFKGKFSTTDIPEPDEKVDIRNIFITSHDPRNVVRLQSERFKMCLGYLVFPDVKYRNNSNHSTNYGSTGMGMGDNGIDELCLKLVDLIYTNIVKDKNQIKNDKMNKDDPELRKYIGLYLSQIKQDEDLNIRYVPPHMMQHFRLNKHGKNYPYGEQILEAIEFDARLLMALKTANTIKTLTHCQDKRVIQVETGLYRDGRKFVDAVREEIKNKKYSIGTMGGVDSIPSRISTFEDIYIPMINGQKQVNFETMDWGQSPNSDIDNMKFIRDNMVANLEVPPAYLSLEENMSNKSLLPYENIIFARAVIRYQNQFADDLHELFEKIYKLIYKDNNKENVDYYFDDIRIGFPPPRQLSFEFSSQSIGAAVQVVEAIAGIVPEIDKKEFLKNQLPDIIDWQSIEQNRIESKIDQLTMEPQGYGGGGMGMDPMMGGGMPIDMGIGAPPPDMGMGGGMPPPMPGM